MPRQTPDELHSISQVLTMSDDVLSRDEKIRYIQQFREEHPELAAQLDRFFYEQLTNSRTGLLEAQRHLKKLKEVIDQLTVTPWYQAVFVAAVTIGSAQRAVVYHGGGRQLVGFAEGVTGLQPGEEVFLSAERNVIMAKSPLGIPRCGEIALYDRSAPNGRLILKCRDEEIVVEVAGVLRDVELKDGDTLRFDRNLGMGFEKIDRSKGTHLFLEETPAVTFAQVGGLDRQITRLQRCLTLHRHHPEVARKYGLKRVGGLMLVGPPGTGKTMLAKALANWIATLSRSGRCRFINIKPSSLHSMWYSESEANYREVFRIAREAGATEPDVPVVMFFDEIESGSGGMRGSSHMRVDDRVLTAFAAELDGLQERGNILVVAATNRRDMVDPALLRPGRLGDLVLEVPRPNMNAAQEILAKHLAADIPYARNGHDGDLAATRQELIESAVSRMYAPNGDSELATITFRDGSHRTVRAADLVSGAVLANLARVACERASLREVELGEPGLQLDDLLTAITEEFDTAARNLTPANCRHHLTGLPQDLDVVAVEPVRRRVPHPYRYIKIT